MLFLTGLFGLFILHANALKEITRENVQLSIYFKDDVKEADILSIQKQLESQPFVKTAKYVSKDEALHAMEKEMGENPSSLLGFNPFPNSIDVHFKPDFVTIDSLTLIKSQLEQKVSVREVNFDALMVQNIDRNIRIAGIVLLSLATIMGLVSIALINNTIRLTLYSKRFLIKSMELVGATGGFIRRPFIYKGFGLGLLSSLFACMLLLSGLYFLTQKFEDLERLQNFTLIGMLMFMLILLGMLISGLSSYFAINKYLKMKLDDLF